MSETNVEKWVNEANSLAEFIEIAEEEEIAVEQQVQAVINEGWGKEISEGRARGILERERERLDAFRDVSFVDSTHAPRYMDLNDIELLSGYEFEHILAEILQRVEGEATVTEATGDQGVDVVWFSDNEIRGIQAKAYDKDNPVSNSAVQEIHTGSKVRESEYSIDIPAVVTTSRYTDGAVEAAESSEVELYDRSDLRQWLSEVEIDAETMGDILDMI